MRATILAPDLSGSLSNALHPSPGRVVSCAVGHGVSAPNGEPLHQRPVECIDGGKRIWDGRGRDRVKGRQRPNPDDGERRLCHVPHRDVFPW